MKLSNIFKSIKRNKLLKTQKGFSLVELMVVVAIIGILASIAIPSYQKFQRKARQSEAKTMLASLYTAEIAFMAEHALGSPNLLQVGFTPSGQVTYLVGFSEKGNLSDATLNLNLTNPPTGYYGPAAKDIEHVNTFEMCEGPHTRSSGITTGSCHVPLGADKEQGGATLTLTAVASCVESSGGGFTSCEMQRSGSTYTCQGVGTGGSLNCATNNPQLSNLARNNTSFNIGAVASIGGTNTDQWTMNQTKTITNVQNGVE